MTLLTLKNLSVRRGQCPVVDNVSLEIRNHELIGLVGPNGAGKTTLLKAALGLIEYSGNSSLAKLPSTSAHQQPLGCHRKGNQLAYFSFGHSRAWTAFTIQNPDKNEIINNALERTGLKLSQPNFN